MHCAPLSRNLSAQYICKLESKHVNSRVIYSELWKQIFQNINNFTYNITLVYIFVMNKSVSHWTVSMTSNISVTISDFRVGFISPLCVAHDALWKFYKDHIVKRILLTDFSLGNLIQCSIDNKYNKSALFLVRWHCTMITYCDNHMSVIGHQRVQTCTWREWFQNTACICKGHFRIDSYWCMAKVPRWTNTICPTLKYGL